MTAATSNPTVSVVLSTYNGARFLRAQLRSLATQEMRPSELVACDDASTDETWDVLRSFEASAPFPVRLHRNVPRMGSRRSFEKGIRLARCEIVALCDQDDVWRSDKIARSVQELTQPSVALVFSDAALVGPAEEPLGFRLWEAIGFAPEMATALAAGDGSLRLLRQNVVTGCASAFWTRHRGLLVPFSPRWVHDYWIAVILGLLGDLRPVPEPLLSYRQHGANQIGVDLEALRQRRVASWQGATPGAARFHYSLAPEAIADLRLHLTAVLDRSTQAGTLDVEARTRMARMLEHLADDVPAPRGEFAPGRSDPSPHVART
jgi:glycosyltransferase involved in cell wall biosynthesis